MPRKVEVTFDEFGWEALTGEAKRQDVTVEDLVEHAAMYYLSEPDRERLSHRVLRDGQDQGPDVSVEGFRGHA
jgi:hypothetical protein